MMKSMSVANDCGMASIRPTAFTGKLILLTLTACCLPPFICACIRQDMFIKVLKIRAGCCYNFMMYCQDIQNVQQTPAGSAGTSLADLKKGLTANVLNTDTLGAVLSRTVRTSPSRRSFWGGYGTVPNER
eukprot:333597-Chlamydomonas_euryale.AAC.1